MHWARPDGLSRVALRLVRWSCRMCVGCFGISTPSWAPPWATPPSTQISSRLLGEGKLRARVDSTFPLERGIAAVERLRDGKQMGKIVVEIGEQ